jgi:ribosomal protein L29
MEFKELKNKKESELQALLAETRTKLHSLQFKDSGKQLKNVREIRKDRQLVARILTKINSLKHENK